MAMEGRGGLVSMLFSLLLSIFSVSFISLAGSISLAARILLGLSGLRSAPADADDHLHAYRQQYDLYEGLVVHVRHQPIFRKFAYGVRYALVNLRDPPVWFEASARHHLRFQEAQAIACTDGPVYLLTIPTSLGYDQNPISLYYCYNHGGEILMKSIAEVTNTPWGERVTFVFDPKSDIIAKPLHVSPFMDSLGHWKIQTSPPGQHLVVKVSVEHPKLGNYFLATLTAKRFENIEQNVEAFFWCMPHRVAVWIYWQAILLLVRGVPFVPHPKYALNSCLGLCPLSMLVGRSCEEANTEQLDDPISVTTLKQSMPAGEQRFCAWREASGWPWK